MTSVEGSATVVVRPKTPERELTAIEKARKALEDEINAHKTQVILKTRELNKLVRIFCLPPELLTEIFLHYAADIRHGSPYYPSSSVYGRDHRSKRWIRIAHVCHHWREVALSSPRLWSEFTVDRLEWTQEMLTRSKRAPLHLTIMAAHGASDALKLAMAELFRIGSLVFKMGSIENIASRLDLGSDAPLLKSLTVTATRPSFMPAISGSEILFDKINLPQLSHLELIDTRISWHNPIFKSTLTHLTFRSNDPLHDYQNTTLHCVLRALENMPALQRLELKGVLPSLSDDMPPLVDDLTIRLPQLRTLVLGALAKTSAFLLQHLVFPANVAIQLDCTDYRSSDISHLCPVLSTKLRSDLEHDVVMPPIRALCISESTFRAWTQEYPLSILDPPPSMNIPPAKAQPKLAISLTHTHCPTVSIFSSLLAALPVANVQSMYIASSDYLMAKKDWIRAWEGMVGLKELGVGRYGEAALPEALASRVPIPGASQPAHAQSSSKKPRRKMQPLLPSLRTLQLSGVRMRRTPPDADDIEDDPGLIPAYMKMLAVRRKSKVPLALRLRECVNVALVDVDKLRKDATSVEWDGVQDWFDEDEYDDEDYYDDPYYEPYDDFTDEDEPPFFFFPW